jgi:hypothetical protein
MSPQLDEPPWATSPEFFASEKVRDSQVEELVNLSQETFAKTNRVASG